MKKSAVIMASLALSLSFALVCCQGNHKDAEIITDETGFSYTAAQLRHGDYLVTSMGCDDCHSPKNFGPNGPEIDLDRRLSGHPSAMPIPKVDTSVLGSWVLLGFTGTSAVGPWGASFSANLTSDATGVGNWKFDNFKTALREGKYKGQKNGRDLLPPMPWTQYRHLSDEDLRDIFAFLKSTKPVENKVPAPRPIADLR